MLVPFMRWATPLHSTPLRLRAWAASAGGAPGCPAGLPPTPQQSQQSSLPASVGEGLETSTAGQTGKFPDVAGVCHRRLRGFSGLTLF